MPRIPEYNRETKLNGAARPYVSVDLNGDMFGAGKAQALGNLGGALNRLSNAAMHIQDTIDDAKLLELSNNIDQWEQVNLYDTENGYYTKYGKDAAGKTGEVMKSYDDFVSDYVSNTRMTPMTERRMNDIIQKKRTRILHGVGQYDIQQTNNWAATEGQTATDNAITGMVHARNNPEDMQTLMNNGLAAVRWQGKTQRLDNDTISAMEKDFKSKAHEAVLNSFLQEGSLKAGEYFNQYKAEIRPDRQAYYIGAIKNEEMNYQARSIAQGLIGLTTQEAYNSIDNIKDINLRNATESEYNRLLRHQETVQQEKDVQLSNDFMQEVYQAFDSGEDISSIMRRVNISDMSLEQKEKIYKNLKEMQELQGVGNNWADYNYLLDMAVFNNEDFKKLNPANYNLTKEQYQKITDMQRKAANNEYSPDVALQEAIHQVTSGFGMQGRNGLHRDEYEQELVKFISKVERMQGQAFNLNNPQQLENIVKAFDYKDPNAKNKNIDETRELYARAAKHGEVSSLMASEYMYFKGANKREPTPEEIYDMAKRSYNTIENRWRERQVKTIQAGQDVYGQVLRTTPKKGETRILTYYADVRIPQISRELGIPLTVTSRYRPDPTSNHSKGRKCDISMSEHNLEQKKKIFERLLSDPGVASIGTSDELLLESYNNPPHPKIRNLKQWDENYKKQHPGTTVNHVNHIDISFDTRYGGDKQGGEI